MALATYVPGWSKLSKVYLVKESFPGTLSRHKLSISLENQTGSRNHTALIGTTVDGIYMAPWPTLLSRWNAPPVFIPWRDIRITDPGLYKYGEAELSFPKVPGITIMFEEWQGIPSG